jgi:hypothetical protein
MKNLSETGIVYLGARADVYQKGAELKKTREALSIFLYHKTPVFIVTRSPEIMVDIDLLQEMSKHSLIEVSITINTKNEKFRTQFEHRTVKHEERLALAKKLTQKGIPVSFHFSPIIPGLDDSQSLLSIMDEIKETGAECIYACLYGMSGKYRDSLIDAFDLVKSGLGKYLAEVYPFKNENVILSPKDEIGLEIIKPLAEYAKLSRILFCSAQFPMLDTGIRESGIFSQKLPTISDLLHIPTPSSSGDLYFVDINNFIEKHPAVDLKYKTAIKEYWDSGELFKNTTFVPVYNNGIVSHYKKTEKLDINTRIMSCIE